MYSMYGAVKARYTHNPHSLPQDDWSIDYQTDVDTAVWEEEFQQTVLKKPKIWYIYNINTYCRQREVSVRVEVLQQDGLSALEAEEKITRYRRDVNPFALSKDHFALMKMLKRDLETLLRTGVNVELQYPVLDFGIRITD